MSFLLIFFYYTFIVIFMKKPTIPQKDPYKVKVEKDKTYFWCVCGLTQKQPIYDESHSKP